MLRPLLIDLQRMTVDEASSEAATEPVPGSNPRKRRAAALTTKVCAAWTVLRDQMRAAQASLPSYLFRPEIVFLPYDLVPGMDTKSPSYIKATKMIASALENGTGPPKRPRLANSAAFGDSASLMDSSSIIFLCLRRTDFQFLLGNQSLVDNSYTRDLLKDAQKIISEGEGNPSELALRRVEGDIRAELVFLTHRVDYALKYRKLLASELQRISGLLDNTASQE